MFLTHQTNTFTVIRCMCPSAFYCINSLSAEAKSLQKAGGMWQTDVLVQLYLMGTRCQVPCWVSKVSETGLVFGSQLRANSCSSHRELHQEEIAFAIAELLLIFPCLHDQKETTPQNLAGKLHFACWRRGVWRWRAAVLVVSSACLSRVSMFGLRQLFCLAAGLMDSCSSL